MQTSRCGADAFYLTNMKAAEHKNVGVGCVWLESWLLDLQAGLKSPLLQAGSSAPAHTTCPETCTNAFFTLYPFPHLQMQDTAYTHFTYCLLIYFCISTTANYASPLGAPVPQLRLSVIAQRLKLLCITLRACSDSS